MMRSAAILALFLSFGSLMAKGPFVDISFEKALKEAEKSRKLVFIDFYTTWCGPCKMLDRNTWKDKKVIDWLGTKTVALKIDAEKEVDLAKKYRITSYPTLVFINPDGSEQGRIVGYRDGTEFLSEAENALRGDMLERMKAELTDGGKINPNKWMKYARALAHKGMYEAAMAEYMKMIENTENNPSVKFLSYSALTQLARLGRHYPPAKEKVDAMHKKARDKVYAFEAGEKDARTLTRLNMALRKKGAALEVFDLYNKEKRDDPLTKVFFQSAYNDLLAARRYDDILERTSVEQELEEAREMHRNTIKHQKKGMEEMMKQAHAYSLTRVYHLMLGTGKVRDAEKLAAEIESLDSSADGYNSLAWTAYESGNTQPFSLSHARKAYELSQGKEAHIIDTLARVLAAMDKVDEAMSLLDEADKQFHEKGHKKMLDKCRREIRAEAVESTP